MNETQLYASVGVLAMALIFALFHIYDLRKQIFEVIADKNLRFKQPSALHQSQNLREDIKRSWQVRVKTNSKGAAFYVAIAKDEALAIARNSNRIIYSLDSYYMTIEKIEL